MRVLVLYNKPVLDLAHPDAESEHEILYTVEHLSDYLTRAGHEVVGLGVGRDPAALLDGVRNARADVVLNLFEGIADHYETETYVAGLLEWLGLPFTGSPSQALALARNKPLAKHLLRGAGLPTADFVAVTALPAPPCPLPWPVIVKPGAQDASVGLDQGSVVRDQPALAARVERLLTAYGPPVLVERFVPGREICLAFVEAPELRALPPSEILFPADDPDFWPIVTYDGKWKPGSPDYEKTPAEYEPRLDPALVARLTELGQRAFRLLGLRDYARVDFRVTPDGAPFILEVNPNPDMSPMAGLSGNLARAGLTHEQFTVDLVRRARARRPA